MPVRTDVPRSSEDWRVLAAGWWATAAAAAAAARRELAPPSRMPGPIAIDLGGRAAAESVSGSGSAGDP
jgi:hypothetical protein